MEIERPDKRVGEFPLAALLTAYVRADTRLREIGETQHTHYELCEAAANVARLRRELDKRERLYCEASAGGQDRLPACDRPAL